MKSQGAVDWTSCVSSGAWPLTITPNRLIKIGAHVARHACKITFHLAEVVVPRNVFGANPHNHPRP